MIETAILSWALIISTGSIDGGISPIYFETKELCERARVVVSKTNGNYTYAKTPCLQLRNESK